MQIQQANKANKKLRIALYGDSGNGKTHSALDMARAFGDRVLVIDSEDGASNSFSDLFAFHVLKIDDPTLDTYALAIDMAIKNQSQFDCVIIDSLSHAWQDALKQVSTFSNTTLGWGKITPKWDSMMHRIKKLNCHVIVTMRAKTRQEGNQSYLTYDSRDNSDYEFDLMLQMVGIKNDNGITVAKARVTKNRFNTDNPKLKINAELNAGVSLMKYIIEWQSTAKEVTDAKA
jgi:hypothetical protein